MDEHEEVSKTERYLYIPADIVSLVDAQVLSITDAWLLANIYTRSRGKVPFFGSNKALGEMTGHLSKHRAREIVAKLVRLDLLKCVGYRTTKTGRQRLLRCALHGTSLVDGRPIEEIGGGGGWENHHTHVRENHHTHVRENPHHNNNNNNNNKNNKENRRSGERLIHKESTVPFIETEQTLKEGISIFDLDCAKQFQKKVLELWPSLAIKWKAINQAKHIAMLRKRVGKAQVKTVIDWYCAIATKETKPRLTNCKQLRERWDDWDLPGKAFKAQDAKIKIDVHTKRIVQSMGMTAGLDVKDLERCTQLTANRMQQFWDCVITIAEQPELKKSVRDQTREEKMKERLKRLAAYFVNGGFPNKWHFTSQWLSDLIRKIDYIQHQNGNSGWKGDLMDQALQLDSKEFNVYGKSITAKFSGSDSQAWDLLLKEINSEEN